MQDAQDFIPLDTTPVAARHGPIPFSFHRTASGEKVTKHGTCALTDDIGGLTKSALVVAAIKAIDVHNGVNRVAATGNKAKLKQKLQESREAEEIRRSASQEQRLQQAHAAELDSARLGVGDSTQEPKADAALDRTQMRRKERCVSELWAYALLHEDGDTLRQPCTRHTPRCAEAGAGLASRKRQSLPPTIMSRRTRSQSPMGSRRWSRRRRCRRQRRQS